ncbi:hypothetical protein BGP_3093 [Beggiatoa sp. PS]|nr:hypothetical protein BGP_3093 [Beggiatoa sp. PS]
MDEEQHPNWLYKALIEDTFPWDKSADLNFQTFNEKYTLHDSVWVGIFYDVAYEQSVILAFQWDAVWLPDELKESTSKIYDWPYLFIKLTNVESVSTANYEDIGGMSRAISGLEIEEIEGKKYLVIDDVYGGQIDIIYEGKESFLVMESNKKVLPA